MIDGDAIYSTYRLSKQKPIEIASYINKLAFNLLNDNELTHSDICNLFDGIEKNLDDDGWNFVESLFLLREKKLDE